METLGSYIKKLREGLDLSLRECARRLNVSAAFLTDIEHGRRFPSDDVFEKIATTLGTTVEELKKRDARVPVKELKELVDADPKFSILFRKLAEKKISADEALRWVERREEQGEEEEE